MLELKQPVGSQIGKPRGATNGFDRHNAAHALQLERAVHDGADCVTAWVVPAGTAAVMAAVGGATLWVVDAVVAVDVVVDVVVDVAVSCPVGVLDVDVA